MPDIENDYEQIAVPPSDVGGLLQVWPSGGMILNQDTGEGQGITVPFSELEGSPTASYEPDNQRAVVSYLIYYRDLRRFRFDVLGYPYLEGGQLRRYLPHVLTHPRFLGSEPDDKPFLYASRILNERGHGKFTRDINGYALYLFAVVDVQYESSYFPILFRSEVQAEHERYVFKRFIPSARLITVEKGTIVIDDPEANGGTPTDPRPKNGSTLAYGVSVVESLGTVEWTWFDVPDDAYSLARLILPKDTDAPELSGLVGCVNDRTFDGYEPGTLLLEGAPELTPRKSITGGQTKEIKFRFQYNGQQHNKIRAANNVHYMTKIVGTDPPKRIFDEENFDLLFQPA